MAKPINIFIIYAREDKEEKRILLDFLSPMIEPYNLNIWHDDYIQPGQEWRPHIESRLNITDIFILLVSVNFLNSKFIKQVEFKYALDRHRENNSVVIPVIIKYCLWDEPLPYDNYSFTLTQLQVLPTEGKPLVEWKSADEAYSNIARGIRSVIIERRANQRKQELQEKEFWNDVIQKNTVASYNEYMQKYPEGDFFEEAKNVILILEEERKAKIEHDKQEIEKAKTQFEKQKIEEEILWQSTGDINTIEAYYNYLEKSRLNNYNEQAKKSIVVIEQKNREIAEQERMLKEEQENNLWNEASNENSISSYQKYLNKTLTGLHEDEARQVLNKLQKAQNEIERESSLWEEAKSKNNSDIFRVYLQKYPNGNYHANALAAIKDIERKNKQKQIEALELSKQEGTKMNNELTEQEDQYKLFNQSKTTSTSVLKKIKYLSGKINFKILFILIFIIGSSLIFFSPVITYSSVKGWSIFDFRRFGYYHGSGSQEINGYLLQDDKIYLVTDGRLDRTIDVKVIYVQSYLKGILIILVLLLLVKFIFSFKSKQTML